VLDGLGWTLRLGERETSDDPRSLARMAARAERRSAGTLEQAFRGPGTEPGMGGGPDASAMVGGPVLGTIPGIVVGSAMARTLFGPAFGDLSQEFAVDEAGSAHASGDYSDLGVGRSFGHQPGGGDSGGGSWGGGGGGDGGGGGGS
jgi:hypothetical protein